MATHHRIVICRNDRVPAVWTIANLARFRGNNATSPTTANASHTIGDVQHSPLVAKNPTQKLCHVMIPSVRRTYFPNHNTPNRTLVTAKR
jgi:hypothetical protein